MSWLGAGSIAEAVEPPACRELELRFDQLERDLVRRQADFFLLGASGVGCERLAERALAAGASAFARDREGNTPLSRAAREGQLAIVKLLLDRRANIEQRNLAGSTPLFLAAEANRTRTVRLLIENGADPNTRGRSGVSVLSAASYHGNERTVELLLARGADPQLADGTGKPPIVYAAARGFTGLVRRFLDRGAEINARYGNDLTLLLWASGHSNDVPVSDGIGTVRLVLERGARLDEIDNRGRTALMIAAELGRAEIVKLLLDRKARRDARDSEGKTAADLAADPETRAALLGQ